MEKMVVVVNLKVINSEALGSIPTGNIRAEDALFLPLAKEESR